MAEYLIATGLLSAIVILALALYFLPTIIAAARQHPNQWPILFVNLLFGWTILGWLAAVLWAISGTGSPLHARPRDAHPQRG